MKSLLDSNSHAIVLVEKDDSAGGSMSDQLEGGDDQIVEAPQAQVSAGGARYMIMKKIPFFEVLLDYCFFDNDDSAARTAARVLRGNAIDVDNAVREQEANQFRSPQELLDVHVEKLQFFIESLSLLGERHTAQYVNLLLSRKFKVTLLSLLKRGQNNLRLKCHEILEILAAFHNNFMVKKKQVEVFVGNQNTYTPENLRGRGLAMNERTGFYEKAIGRAGRSLPEAHSEVIDVEYMTPARIALAQLMIECVKRSCGGGGTDSYLQFNSLILLDNLF